MSMENYKPWKVYTVIDRRKQYPDSKDVMLFPYEVHGENLNWPEGHMSRKFIWTVPNIGAEYYDLSEAIFL